jgi:hypothetical protein
MAVTAAGVVLAKHAMLVVFLCRVTTGGMAIMILAKVLVVAEAIPPMVATEPILLVVLVVLVLQIQLLVLV